MVWEELVVVGRELVVVRYALHAEAVDVSVVWQESVVVWEELIVDVLTYMKKNSYGRHDSCVNVCVYIHT